MNIFVCILILILGLIVVIVGGNYLVDVSSKICKITNLSEMLVGATLTSFATTLPEITISILATLQDSASIIVGDGFGTIIVNNCLILGLSLTFSGLKRISKQNINRIVIMLTACIFVGIFALFNFLNLYSGLLLISLFVIYIIYSSKDIKLQSKNNEKNKEKLNKKEIIILVLKFVAGMLFIFAGAQFIVNSTENLALKLNIDSHIIAATIVSLGTSIPELATCIISIRRKRINLAIGNIIGANTVVLSFLFGLCSILSGTSGLNVSTNAVISTLPIMLMSTFVIATPIVINRRTYKYQGYALLSLYLFSFVLILIAF